MIQALRQRNLDSSSDMVRERKKGRVAHCQNVDESLYFPGRFLGELLSGLKDPVSCGLLFVSVFCGGTGKLGTV